MSVQAKLFIISGVVQGVGFRFFAQRTARALGITGYVKNLRNARVEVFAVGSAEQLDALRGQLERGPRGAQVQRVEEHDAALDPRYAGSFSIESDW